MGLVGAEVPALVLRLRQRACHVVKARRQLADLISPVGVLHPYVEVPGGVGPMTRAMLMKNILTAAQQHRQEI